MLLLAIIVWAFFYPSEPPTDLLLPAIASGEHLATVYAGMKLSWRSENEKEKLWHWAWFEAIPDEHIDILHCDNEIFPSENLINETTESCFRSAMKRKLNFNECHAENRHHMTTLGGCEIINYTCTVILKLPPRTPIAIAVDCVYAIFFSVVASHKFFIAWSTFSLFVLFLACSATFKKIIFISFSPLSLCCCYDNLVFVLKCQYHLYTLFFWQLSTSFMWLRSLSEKGDLLRVGGKKYSSWVHIEVESCGREK